MGRRPERRSEDGRRLSSPLVFVPIGLTVVFAVLFFPVARERYELLTTLVFTLVGVCVIWASYLVRAHIFSGWEKDGAGKARRRS